MERKWYIVVENKRIGPLASLAIQNLFNNGRIDVNTLTWCHGMDNWSELKNIDELSLLVIGPQPPPLPPVFKTKRQIANNELFQSDITPQNKDISHSATQQIPHKESSSNINNFISIEQEKCIKKPIEIDMLLQFSREVNTQSQFTLSELREFFITTLIAKSSEGAFVVSFNAVNDMDILMQYRGNRSIDATLRFTESANTINIQLHGIKALTLRTVLEKTGLLLLCMTAIPIFLPCLFCFAAEKMIDDGSFEKNMNDTSEELAANLGITFIEQN